MSQVLDKQIAEHLSLLHDDEKKSILSVIKSFLSHRKETPERVSIEQYNKELDKAEAQFKSGNFITHEEMIKRVKKW